MRHTPSAWLAISLVVAILGATLSAVTVAQEVGVESTYTINGCDVTPRTPDKVQGQLVARAKVECASALAGRQIIVELWQKTPMAFGR